MPHQATGASFLAERGAAILADEPGAGKAQPVWCKVLTPVGWQDIGDVRPGDDVMDANGRPVIVRSVHRRGMLPTWKIGFSDGAYTFCSYDHLWAVNSPNRLWRGRDDWTVKPLSEIAEPKDVRIRGALKTKDGKRRWRIPVMRAAEFNRDDDLLLDPYVLGCLLGDGHIKRSTVSLTKPDMDMHAEVQRRLLASFDGIRFKIKKNAVCPTMHVVGDGSIAGKHKNPVLSVLKRMGLQGTGSFDRFVPEPYLFASVQARLDLLRGLMDTDGTAGKNTVFGSRSERLANAVAHLVRSLGGVAYETANMKVGAMFYMVTVAMREGLNPFSIVRKSSAWRPRTHYMPQRFMDSVEPYGTAECVCLTVDSEDGLYVTDGFLVTHNSPQVVLAADLTRSARGLLSCPASVRGHWENTFLEWQAIDRPVAAVDGRVREPPGPGVTVVSHAAFADPASLDMMMRGAPYDFVVLDEAHAFRQYDAARTREMLGPTGAWTWAPRFWALTGTPIVNSAADLWPFAYGPLRSPTAWYDWCTAFSDEVRQDAYGAIKSIGVRDPARLADAMRPHMLRRTLAGVGVSLPPMATSRVAVPLPDDAMARIMADLENWTPDRLAAALDEKDELHDSALARVRKALGIAKVPAVVDHLACAAALGECPIVVFFQHTAVREALFAALKARGAAVSWVDGKTTAPRIRAAVEWFQAGRLDVLLVQTDAGGVGLTLTRSNRAVEAETPWTSVARLQAFKRVHRITQGRPVLAEVLSAQGCWLEDVLGSTVARKQRASEAFLALLETKN